MSSKNLREGVKLAKKLYETEASGSVTLYNVRKIARTGVDRISIGALSVGTALGAYERSLKYSKERKAFNQPINEFQQIGFKLADMATKIEASKLLVYHAAWLKDHGHYITKEAAMAKLFASETAMEVTTEAIQIHGGYGYMKEYDVERFFVMQKFWR